MRNMDRFKQRASDLMHLAVAGKDKERPILQLMELMLLVAAMIALMFYDPFRLTAKVSDYLRLNFPLFTKEPRFLYHASLYFGSFIFKIITIAFIAILLVIDRIEVEDELALKKPSSGGWKWYIIPFTVLSAFLRTSYCSNPLVTNMPLRLVTPEAMLIGNIIVFFSVVVIAPITEELIFRGYMYDIFRRSFGAYIAVGVTALLFALAHMPQLGCEPYAFLAIFALGIIFGLARQKTDSILPPIIFHGIYNFVYIALGLVNFYILGY
jgi:membrane protease YdiL (CAAX protease family)